MNLENISIAARPRSPWQAIDLGFVLARQWWRPLLLSWLIPALVCFLLCSALLYDKPWLSLLLTWWLKPLWDRAPLYFASHALFGETLTVRQTLRQLPQLYRKDWLAWLSWRRLSLSRSFDMPVTVLESLSGKLRSSRQSILHYGSNSGAASWLLIICIHLEMIISFGIVSLFFWLMPEQLEFDWQDLSFYEQVLPQHLYNFLIFIGMALVAPFYTLAGFCLYISRRIDLEGWDIEIRFRHLAQQTAAAQRPSATPTPSPPSQSRTGNLLSLGGLITVAMSLVLTLGLLSPLPASAQNTDSQTEPVIEASINAPSPAQSQAATTIEQILAGEDFHTDKEIRGWRLKDQSAEDENQQMPEWLITLVEYLEGLGGFMTGFTALFSGGASVLEFLLWLSLTAIVLYGLYHFRAQGRQLLVSFTRRDDRREAAPPEVLFGLDVRQQSLPKDVPTEVQQLWDQGHAREALSLLYRATLSSLIHNHQLRFAVSDTEGECVDKVQRANKPTLSAYTERLTGCWQQLAYGHQAPSTTQVQTLCQQWQQLFAEAQSPLASAPASRPVP